MPCVDLELPPTGGMFATGRDATMPPVVIEALSLDFVESEQPAMLTKQNKRLISDVKCLTIDCISPSEASVIGREAIMI